MRRILALRYAIVGAGFNRIAQGKFTAPYRAISVVARMECNGIREERDIALPDCTTFHPGYVFCHISLNRPRR